MMERERRKGPRFEVWFRVFFPEFNIEGLASNISLDGCYVKTTTNMESEGRVQLVIELPVVGSVLLNGYVHHHSVQPAQGVGLQFIHVGFSPEESIYYGVFSRFIKILSQLQDVREYYQQTCDQESLNPIDYPSASAD